MTADDEVKYPTVFYRAVVEGKLTFLLLPYVADRYRLHDVIKLVEVDAVGEVLGPMCFVRVLFIIADPALGVREGYAAIAIKKELESSRYSLRSLGIDPDKPKDSE